MDRLALSLVLLGLLMILGTVVTVLGSASPELSGPAAAAAALAGAAIVGGLVILERRTVRFTMGGQTALAVPPRPVPASIADGAA